MSFRHIAAVTGLLFALSSPALAEIPGAYGMWGDTPRSNSPSFGFFGKSKKQKPNPTLAAFSPGMMGKPKELLQGGGKPSISPKAPQVVSYGGGYSKGSVVVDQSQKKLYYVLGDGKAYAYPVAVGKKGFKWTGSQKVSSVKSWPDWVPPEEMRQRKPNLPLRMTGGINNPLGAKAIYLGNSLYRIHGTNDSSSIGTEASSGCIRMHNGHVVHLAQLVKPGTAVHVVH
jgi:lipoprotein-anchoring transpeptidase ErfK/SrfK